MLRWRYNHTMSLLLSTTQHVQRGLHLLGHERGLRVVKRRTVWQIRKVIRTLSELFFFRVIGLELYIRGVSGNQFAT